MIKRTMTETIALRLIVFFARNPEEWLTSADIVEKFGVEGENLRHSLRGCVAAGLLERVSDGAGRGRVATYRAGERLLQMFGRPQQVSLTTAGLLATACMSVGARNSGFANLTVR